MVQTYVILTLKNKGILMTKVEALKIGEEFTAKFFHVLPSVWKKGIHGCLQGSSAGVDGISRETSFANSDSECWPSLLPPKKEPVSSAQEHPLCLAGTALGGRC